MYSPTASVRARCARDRLLDRTVKYMPIPHAISSITVAAAMSILGFPRMRSLQVRTSSAEEIARFAFFLGTARIR